MARRLALPRVFYGWIIVGVSVVALTILWGSQYSFGVFFKPLSAEFNWSRATTSLGYSIFMMVHGLTQPVVGFLSDRWGPRKPIIIAGAGMGIGYLLMSGIAELWQFYVYYGLIVGIAISFALVPLTSTVSRWFTARRGLALGIAVTGIGLGGVVMAPLSQTLISGLGWRQSYAILATLVLAIVVPLSLLLFPNPSRKGLRPYGEDVAPVAFAGATPGDGARSLTARQALKTRTFWQLVVVFVMCVLCHQIVLVHIVPHATDLGVSPLRASAILSLIGLWATAAKVGFGFISDRIGCKRTLLIILGLMGTSMVLLAMVKQQWFFYLFAVLFGFAYGGYSAMYPATIGEFFGTKHHGSVFGTMLAFSGLSGSTGPLLAGYVYDVTGKYDLAFLIAGIATFAALLAGLSLRPPKPTTVR